MDWRTDERSRLVAIILLWWMMFVLRRAIAKEHVVGNAMGWTNAGFNYTRWAASNHFSVGDTLLFNYVPEDHTVVEVTETSFQACNLGDPIATYTDGSTVIRLPDVRCYYYVCGVGLHCLEGQKLEVEVNSEVGNLPPVPSPSKELSGADLSSRLLLTLHIAIALLALLSLL